MMHLRVLLLGIGCSLVAILAAGTEIAGQDKNAKVQNGELHPAQFSPEFIGMHTLSPTRHWPAIPFGSIRPAGTSWGALEPASGQYDWHSLDSWAAQAQMHHVQLDYVFLNTPAWASTRPNEPCIGRKVGCAAPPNLRDWDEFVTALVTRYKGRISSYELWNEPNGSGFWSGTPGQLAELAAHAYPIIKSIDPAAIVTTPAASSSGWPLSHDAWLDQYLSAGGAKYADVVAWHGYAGRNDRPALPPEGLAQQIEALRAVLARHHLSQMPIWNTEGGWGKDAQLPDENEQASFLVKWFLINFTYGIQRAYWYQWDNPDWGTLWREGTGVTPAGIGAGQVSRWLQGTSAAKPCRAEPSSKLWMCELQRQDGLYRVVWSASGQSTYSDVGNVESVTVVGGEPHPAPSQPLTVGSEPVFLKLAAR